MENQMTFEQANRALEETVRKLEDSSLSLNDSIIKDLGTRHRAGIGMSENSDAVVVIVSEETGTISIALDGKLKRGYDTDSLAAELEGLLITDNIYRKIKDRKGTKK